MAAKANLTKSADISFAAREIDFVTQFNRSWEHLRDIMGIMRPIRKQPGTALKYKEAVVTLASGTVGEGEEIPYSKTEFKETTFAEMGVEKYSKGVSIEAIKDHGYEVAVGMSDEAFQYELQNTVVEKFYTFLNTGTLTSTETSFKRAMAMAKGAVVNKFKKMHRNCTEVVAFVNVLDVYDYIGDAELTVQSDFGLQYIKNFMGYRTVFLLSEDEIARNKVIATPVDNIVLYYVDPGTSDFAKAGLTFTVAGETNLVGFHAQGNYKTAVSEAYAIMGMVLFAEYLDGIAVVTVNPAAAAKG